MLDVYLHSEHIGAIAQHDGALGLTFTYNERALDQPDRFALSVQLPVRAAPYPHHLAAPFFDNLLPEGETRDILAQAEKYDRSDVQALLGAIGGECAGAVSLWPAGEAPSIVPDYAPCTAADIERLFNGGDVEGFAHAHVTGRQSMSGVQDKLVLLRRGTRYALPRRGAPTNVILKHERQRYPGLVQNELAALRLMALAGVTVVEATAPVGFTGLFETVRYDRVTKNDRITRLHQEDFCQATGKFPRQKYQQEGGPAIADLATVIIRYSSDPLADLELLARWTIVNLCLGNNDAHAKNLSLLYTEQGIRLAPAYDVVCTLAYESLNKRLSLAFGGVYTIEGVTALAFRKCARALRMTPVRLAQIMDEVTTQLVTHVDAVCHGTAAQYGDVSALQHLRNAVVGRSGMLVDCSRRQL